MEASGGCRPGLRAIAAAVHRRCRIALNRRYFALLPTSAAAWRGAREPPMDEEAPQPEGSRMKYRVRHATRYTYETPRSISPAICCTWRRAALPMPERAEAPAITVHAKRQYGPGDAAHGPFRQCGELAVPGRPRMRSSRSLPNHMVDVELSQSRRTFRLQTPPWEQVADPGAGPVVPGAWQAAEFVFDSPHAAADPGRRRLCRRSSFTPGRPILEALLAH